MYKYSSIFFVLIFLIIVAIPAQENDSRIVSGMTFTGSTGLIIVPDAQIGHIRGDLGFNAGYSLILTRNSILEHLPRFSLTLFNRLEFSGLLHIDETNIKNGVLGTKLQLFEEKGTALAIGGDVEITNSSMFAGDNAKIYLSATYSGNFFRMPATTTMTFGWNLLYEGVFSSQLLYGMGFSIGLFPDTLHNRLIWVTDFSNFSYAVHGAIVDAVDKGALNTGLRVHLLKNNSFNVFLGIMGTDLLDTSRGISFSISGGFMRGKKSSDPIQR